MTTYQEKMKYFNSFEYVAGQIKKIENELAEKYGTKTPPMDKENECILRDLHDQQMKANKIAGIKIY